MPQGVGPWSNVWNWFDPDPLIKRARDAETRKGRVSAHRVRAGRLRSGRSLSLLRTLMPNVLKNLRGRQLARYLLEMAGMVVLSDNPRSGSAETCPPPPHAAKTPTDAAGANGRGGTVASQPQVRGDLSTVPSALGDPGEPRYHGLDAFRAATMLKVVALHAALAYTRLPIPNLIWLVQDPSAHLAFDLFCWWSIGISSPFFLLSRFFARQLYSTRGARAFVENKIGYWLHGRRDHLPRIASPYFSSRLYLACQVVYMKPMISGTPRAAEFHCSKLDKSLTS